MSDVRAATQADVETMSHMLARAFQDDPVVMHLVPSQRRAARFSRYLATAARRDLTHGAVYTTPGIEGAALWVAPDQWKLKLGELVRETPTAVRAFGRRLPRALRSLATLEKHHPTEPHWYLAVLGTDPVHQGKGIGSALLAPILERCDTEGLPAYLESSKESNVPFYARHGFTVTEEFRVAGGPPVWGMWRKAA